MKKHSLSRSEQTEKTIQDAFIALCLEQGRLDISVSDLTARAQIGRSTFYTHYEDIYALIDVMQSQLLDTFQKNISGAIPAILAQDDDLLATFFKLNATFLWDNKNVFLVFIGKNGSTQFIYKMKRMAKDNLRRLFSSHPSKYTEYILEFMVSAFLGLISYWLENDEPLSYKELTVMLRTILYQGPLAAGMGKTPEQGK